MFKEEIIKTIITSKAIGEFKNKIKKVPPANFFMFSNN